MQKPITPTGPIDFHFVDAGLDVEQHFRPVDLGDVGARMRDLVGRIAGLEIAHEAVEQGGRHRDIAFRREPVADIADMAVDAEYLLPTTIAPFGLPMGSAR